MATYKEPPDDEYSGAKLTILKMLWDGEWILGDEILKAIKQSYYDRRIRELRDEDGWDIETGWLSNKRGVKRPAYRLVSHNRQGGVKRISISADDRAFVLERDDYSCQLCGVTLKDGMNNPQIDHKVPLIRKGANDRSNYQAICSNCSVIKRGICKKC
ncbi:MAG: HNH endonuclease, partial [Chloroflexi bacterium]|nr:HNH endonuclease [Chloroflexota bacterium]